MTNNEWLDKQSVERLIEMFYGMYFAIDGRFDSLDLTVKADKNWEKFRDPFTDYFEPIYEELAGTERIAKWYQSEWLQEECDE